MPADGRWDLTWRLKGSTFSQATSYHKLWYDCNAITETPKPQHLTFLLACGLDSMGFTFWKGPEIFLFLKMSRPVLVYTQSLL
jgi:hypothetical protein